MNLDTPQNIAIAFIATYDVKDGDAYQQHVTRIARSWLSILRSRHSVQGIVNTLMDEFDQPVPDDYGFGWLELKKHFTTWAIREDWWEASD